MKCPDESAVQSAVGIAAELSKVALNGVQLANGERMMIFDIEGMIRMLKLSEPSKGWCGMRTGTVNRKL